MAYTPYKMKGHTLPGIKQSPNSPLQYGEGAKNLLKAVPNKEAYDKLSDEAKKGFDKAAKKAGLPTKKEKKAPTKWVQAVAALAPIAAKALGGAMDKKKEEE